MIIVHSTGEEVIVLYTSTIIFSYLVNYIQLTLDISTSQGDEEIVRDIESSRCRSFFSLGNDHGTEDFVRHSESSRYRIVDISSVNCI